MKKKILLAIYVLLIVIAFKFGLNIINNKVFIYRFNNSNYSEVHAKISTYVVFIQNYVFKYNYGNVLYKNGKYEEAIQEYRKVLNQFIPKNKECSVRINYALAICNTVYVDEEDEISINNAIERYEEAIDVLTEKGCANKEDDNGHNKTAETLKKDIQKEIDRLKKLKQNKQDKKDENDNNEDNSNKEKEKDVEEKMQKVKEDATKTQRDSENNSSNFNKINTIFQRPKNRKIW